MMHDPSELNHSEQGSSELLKSDHFDVCIRPDKDDIAREDRLTDINLQQIKMAMKEDSKQMTEHFYVKPLRQSKDFSEEHVNEALGKLKRVF